VTAAELKDALMRRHPAIDPFGGPGPWTCISEWMNIDLLAVCAWSSFKPYPRYARVGYEVKVSRADYKRELANPGKRAAAVAFTHEFYFAVPHGLLKPDEVQWVPPPGFDDALPFNRPHCPGAYGARCDLGRVRFGIVHPPKPRDRLTRYRADYARMYDAICPTCRGQGWLAESPAIRASAPALWVPADVGLVVVYPGGRVVTAKKAPRRLPWPQTHTAWNAIAEHGMSDAQLADLVRWVSFRT
jgi:hypothetical protein